MVEPGSAEVFAVARGHLPIWVPWLWPAVCLPGAYLLGRVASGLALRVASRPLVRAADAPWPERARHTAALDRVTILAALLGPIVAFAIATQGLGPMAALPSRVLIAGAAAAAFVGHLGATTAQQRRLGLEIASAPVQVRSWLTAWLLFLPALPVAALTAFAMPFAWGPQAWATLALGAALGLALVFGGSVRLLKLAGVVRPAAAELDALAAEVAAEVGVAAPRTFELRVPDANAMAIYFPRCLLITAGLAETLERDELRTVIAHEVGHLAGPRPRTIRRALNILVPLPYAAVPALLPEVGVVPAVFGCLAAAFALRIAFRSAPVAEEERADAVAREHGGDPAAYARALEKIHRHGLAPAVATRRTSHPHLYDRMLAAGVQPDYPRPEAPPRRTVILGAATAIAVLFAAGTGVERLRADCLDAVSGGTGGHEMAIALTGGHPWILLGLAEREVEQERFETGLAFGRAAVEAADPSTWLQLELAGLCEEAGEGAEALACLEEATAAVVEPSTGVDPWSAVEASRQWLLRGRADEALRTYERARASIDEPGWWTGDGHLRVGLGRAAVRLDRHDEATEHCEAARGFEGDAHSFARFAGLLGDLGLREEAAAALARARSLASAEGSSEALEAFVPEYESRWPTPPPISHSH